MKYSRLYRVEFFEAPLSGKENVFYYTKLSLLFEEFSQKDIGCTLGTLRSHALHAGERQVTKKCIITRHEMRVGNDE